jgi:hypothetical protein
VADLDILDNYFKRNALCEELIRLGHGAHLIAQARRESYHAGYGDGIRDAESNRCGRHSPQRERAVGFLIRELRNGSRSAEEMKQRAEAEGITQRTLDRVRPGLVESRPKAVDGKTKWWWSLNVSTNFANSAT